ncbi:transcriptional regulator [Lelliottia wanjuensis]|uniref:YdaS family helix-turn-helix protein n=1 Tax=Lelliottia wanjuensis TaxID=3050585 RepID=A0AAP4FSV8_9ENTR|nr:MULTISPECIES: YdaS family helix-turn-helix protein [unclassified Lelliottia]MDK9364203.1 YdaS family helix-turn-helix protein [Lelliottia sp. V106_12]MDK9617120.1 YdaS family helix-turn-helix protein [Lelliottia sp. V106_9]
MTGLEKAIFKAGSQARLATLLGISTQSVNRWKQKYKGVIPVERVLPIFRATGVTPHELRPDLHPTPTSGIPDNTAVNQKDSD